MSAEHVETISDTDFNFLKLVNELAGFKIKEAIKEGVDPELLPINLEIDSDEVIGMYAYNCDSLVRRLEELTEIAKSNRHAALLTLGRNLRDKNKGEFTLVDDAGRKLCAIKSNVEVYASIKDIEKAEAWLNNNGLEDVLKPDIKWPETKEQCEAIIELLDNNGFEDYTTARAHPATLAAAMREHAYAGEILPTIEDGIAVTMQPLAKISKARS